MGGGVASAGELFPANFVGAGVLDGQMFLGSQVNLAESNSSFFMGKNFGVSLDF